MPFQGARDTGMRKAAQIPIFMNLYLAGVDSKCIKIYENVRWGKAV